MPGSGSFCCQYQRYKWGKIFLLSFLVIYSVSLFRWTYSTTLFGSSRANGNGFSDESMFQCARRNFEKPVRKFVYHSLHKTGSMHLRNKIRAYCRDPNQWIETLADLCTEQQTIHYDVCVSRDSPGHVQPYIDAGSITFARMKKCCSNFDNSTIVDALIDHWRMDDLLTRDLFWKLFTPMPFRFTVLRNPYDQFRSYYKYARTPRHLSYRHLPIPDKFETFVELLYNRTITGQPVSNRIGHEYLYRMFTNSQSKELGWNPEWNNLDEILQQLYSMDFIGLSEHANITYRTLQLKLGWPKNFFTGAGESTHYELEPRLVAMITKIQHADLKLYNAALAWHQKCVQTF